ncbi:hypothetical protein LTR86_008914 [Recurvomyces mirabilis]|nr:hypothetical protein LTR86_008914 [Recurvomyces mirabilis]
MSNMNEADQLKAVMRQMQEDNKGFADALQRRDSSRNFTHLPSNIGSTENSPLLTRRNTVENVASLQPTASRQSYVPRAIEQYNQRMAEAALTRNGRDLKAKATTKVDKSNHVCWNSSYSRPASEILEGLLGRRSQ